MAALDFPASPTNGQVYTANSRSWIYDSATTSWLAFGTTNPLPITLGGTGSTTAAAARTAFGAVAIAGDTMTGILGVDIAGNQLYLHNGSASSTPTVIHRNDGAYYYVLLSAAGAISGTWNTLRPLYINCSTGALASNNGQAFVGGCSIDTLTLTNDLTVANGGTGVSTLTGIVKGNGTAAFTAAAAGTDYVAPGGALGTPSSGTLTNCTGYPMPSGSRILLNTITISNNASVSDTTSLTSAYDWYEIILENVQVFNTSNTLYIQVQSGGAYQATAYYYINCLYGTGVAPASSATGTYIPLSQVGYLANTLNGTSGFLRIFRPSNATTNKAIVGQVTGPHISTTLAGYQINGWWNNGTGAITGFQIVAASGNLFNGVIKVYGVKV